MKKLLISLFIFSIGLSVFAQVPVPMVAVAPFSATGGVTADEAHIVTELFIAELVSTGKVNVVDRASFDLRMSEMHFQESDWASRDKTAQLGRSLNAGAIIRGQLMKMGDRIYWTATIIDVTTGQILSSAREQVSNINQVFTRLPEFCHQIVANLPKPVYKIGDRGPGGGTVFFAEGGQYMECSGDLGKYEYRDALNAAKNYRGGGFNDWRLPTIQELELILVQLKVNDFRRFLWSSTFSRRYQNVWDNVWYNVYWIGWYNDNKFNREDTMGSAENSHYTCAVRSFN